MCSTQLCYFRSRSSQITSCRSPHSRRNQCPRSWWWWSLGYRSLWTVTEADHVDVDTVDSAKAGDSSTGVEKILARKEVSAATVQRDFDLSDVLDYVKTGVACILVLF